MAAESGQGLGAQHHMAAVEEAIVLFILEGGRKVEQVEGAGEVFEGIVEIGRGFGVLADDQVVELAGGCVLKDGGDEEGGGAALEVLTGYPLRGRQ